MTRVHEIRARYETLGGCEFWLGWDCACGEGGPDQASLTLHAHETTATVRRWDGVYVDGLYREVAGD